MRIFITGATGLIGSRLVLDRLERGDRVVLLSRNAAKAARRFAADANPNVEVVEGDPGIPGEWQQRVSGCDAVVHLAGAGIADKRWTAEYKREIAESRIDSTYQVVEAISRAQVRPSVLVSGSAVGYYGECGDEVIEESHPPGPSDDFLVKVSVQWEEQAKRAATFGVRVITLRTAPVLDSRDGALPQMMLPFRYFAGGPIGSGSQFMPWIHWRDLVGIIAHALRDKRMDGAVNGAAPDAVRNREFSSALGRAMGRPSWLPVPKFALRVVMGEVARYVAMSQRVVPMKAQSLGYEFLYPTIDDALEALVVKRPKEEAASTQVQAGRAAETAAGPGEPVVNTPAKPEASSSPSRAVKLLAVPVDGALIRSDGTISPGDVQAIRAAERAGCTVILATSRPPRAVRSILQTLGIAGPTITHSGALIWNQMDNVALFHQALDQTLAREIVDAVRATEPSLPIVLEVLDGWYTDNVDAEAAWLPGRMRDADHVGELSSFLDQPVTRISLHGSESQLANVLPMVRETFWKPRRIALFQPDVGLVQMTDSRVDKAVALQRIAMRLGLQREEVMAIGDSRIDSGMIEWSGFSVALENAPQSVRELADAVVPSHDQSGVARAIHRFVLSGR
jgi:uncharacterized protein (TIGR01777 family)